MTTWCNPPTHRGRLWVELLTPVMDRPGEWALVRSYDRPEAAQQGAKYLRDSASGRRRGRVPAGQWEFTSRQVQWDVAEWGVWARWMGEA